LLFGANNAVAAMLTFSDTSGVARRCSAAVKGAHAGVVSGRPTAAGASLAAVAPAGSAMVGWYWNTMSPKDSSGTRITLECGFCEPL
jgi:hypothetical protein